SGEVGAWIHSLLDRQRKDGFTRSGVLEEILATIQQCLDDEFTRWIELVAQTVDERLTEQTPKPVDPGLLAEIGRIIDEAARCAPAGVTANRAQPTRDRYAAHSAT
ncbi:MAG: hypothetical protein AB7W59_27365, partial [Acidimicrobiia bacterium]